MALTDPATARQVGMIGALLYRARLYRAARPGWDAHDARLAWLPDEVLHGEGKVRDRLAGLTRRQASELIDALRPVPATRRVLELHHRSAEVVVSGDPALIERTWKWIDARMPAGLERPHREYNCIFVLYGAHEEGWTWDELVLGLDAEVVNS